MGRDRQTFCTHSRFATTDVIGRIGKSGIARRPHRLGIHRSQARRLSRTGLVCLSNEAHRHRQHPAAETLRVGGTVPPAEKHPPTPPAFRTGVKSAVFCNFSLKFHRLQLQKCALFYEFFFIFPNSNLRPSNSLPAISKAKRSLSASRTLSCTARNSCTLAPNALTISSPIFMEE